ncbi:MAG: hypothetical protein WDZ63_02885 [Burkholderiales bacterium]
MRTLLPASMQAVLILLLVTALTACATPRQVPPDIQVSSALPDGVFGSHAIAFLTPSTSGGQEDDKQSLAFAFATTLTEARPEVRVVTLAQTLGAVNRAGMTRDYERMYEGFRATGVLDRKVLAKLRGITGARFFALLQLGDFHREAGARALAPGLAADTERARIRLFLQVWDSIDGTVAWEGLNEAVYSSDTPDEKTVSFRSVVERAAGDLIALLP